MGVVKTCGYCGEGYYPGPASGELWVWYPQGEAMYWKHVRESTKHQRMLTVQAYIVHVQLSEAGEILNEARKARARERARIKRQEKKDALAASTAGDH